MNKALPTIEMRIPRTYRRSLAATRRTDEVWLELAEHGLHLRPRERVDVGRSSHPLDQLDHARAVYLAVGTHEIREPRELEDAADLRLRRGARVAAGAEAHQRDVVEPDGLGRD